MRFTVVNWIFVWSILGVVGCNPDQPLSFTCSSDEQCDDHVYCNGNETCDPSHDWADRFGCVRGIPCSASCNEGDMACKFAPDEFRPDACPSDAVLADVTCEHSSCSSDDECDDGLFCNGEEFCLPENPLADVDGCVPAKNRPCEEAAACDERSDLCQTECDLNGDQDRDGHDTIGCGGDDCDDTNPNRYPGNTEICDDANLDEDCDPTTFGVRDVDGDGYIDARCANASNAGVDCNDLVAEIHPTTPELCNGIDDNCNGEVDEGVLVDSYPDLDGDGYGAHGASPQQSCPGGAALSPNDFDCDDTNPSLFPGQIVCESMSSAKYSLCGPDGLTSAGACSGQGLCLPQPGGFGVCF